MKRIGVGLGICLVIAACGVDDFQPVVATPAGDAGDAGPVAIGEPAVPCADPADAIYADPGALPPENGAILKCSKGAELTKEQVQGRLTAASTLWPPCE